MPRAPASATSWRERTIGDGWWWDVTQVLEDLFFLATGRLDALWSNVCLSKNDGAREMLAHTTKNLTQAPAIHMALTRFWGRITTRGDASFFGRAKTDPLCFDVSSWFQETRSSVTDKSHERSTIRVL